MANHETGNTDWTDYHAKPLVDAYAQLENGERVDFVMLPDDMGGEVAKAVPIASEEVETSLFDEGSDYTIGPDGRIWRLWSY